MVERSRRPFPPLSSTGHVPCLACRGRSREKNWIIGVKCFSLNKRHVEADIWDLAQLVCLESVLATKRSLELMLMVGDSEWKIMRNADFFACSFWF